MNIGRLVEKLMAMDDEAWSRHANPWSGWSRATILPLLTLAVWSRVWLGWWSLVPIVVLLVWTWANPRIFSKPESTRAWVSRGVLGERVWLNRGKIPIPAHHARMANLLSVAPALGLVPYVWGLVQLDLPLTLTGMVLTMGAKFWFLDRMVWLYEDMKGASAEYQSWLK